MYKASTILDKKSLINLYYSVVNHYLIYCIEIWVSATQPHLYTLFLSHTQFVRVITFSHYLAHTQPLFIHLSIMCLDKLILNRIGIIMYAYSGDFSPRCNEHIIIKYNKDVLSHHIRGKHLLRIPKGTLRFSNLSARIWNGIVNTVNVNVPLYIMYMHVCRCICVFMYIMCMYIQYKCCSYTQYIACVFYYHSPVTILHIS